MRQADYRQPNRVRRDPLSTEWLLSKELGRERWSASLTLGKHFELPQLNRQLNDSFPAFGSQKRTDRFRPKSRSDIISLSSHLVVQLTNLTCWQHIQFDLKTARSGKDSFAIGGVAFQLERVTCIAIVKG